MTSLCLVRHAIAEERGPAWPNDNLRPLSTEGLLRMEEAARGLARLVPPSPVLTSPLIRARQTAEIIAAALDGAEVRETSALAGDDTAALIEAALAQGSECVIAVGHEPSLSIVLSELLFDEGPGAMFEYKKGGAALIQFDGRMAPGEGRLEWFLPPRVLRAVGRSG